jgi:hypothetical protein
VKSIGSLVQARRKELVTYWDRVDNVMKRCTKEKLAALPAALTLQQAYILARDNIAELLFMHGMLPDVRKTVESMAVEATTLTELKEIGFRADKAMRIEMKIGEGGQTVAALNYTEAQGAGAGAGAGVTAGAGAGHQQPFNDPGGNNAIAQQEAIVKMQQRTLAAMTAGSARAPGRRNTSRGGARGGGAGRGNGGTRKPLAEIPMEDRLQSDADAAVNGDSIWRKSVRFRPLKSITPTRTRTFQNQ